jgi:hypothetical protein
MPDAVRLSSSLLLIELSSMALNFLLTKEIYQNYWTEMTLNRKPKKSFRPINSIEFHQVCLPFFYISGEWTGEIFLRLVFFYIVRIVFFFFFFFFFYKYLTEEAYARTLSLVHCIAREREGERDEKNRRRREKDTNILFLSIIIICPFNYLRGSRKQERERERKKTA